MANRTAVAALSCLGFGGLVLHFYLQRNLETRSAQQRLMKQDEERLFGKGSDQGPSKRALEDMLFGLKAKTAREKVEAAVDAAHRTHNIGFPSRNDAAHKEK